ncbi:hypothetical protein FRC17_003512 [Serendipita sp. 399]|nr:hypothetical protein FRC17_003512 [Serendipita sp. 399]
MEPSSATKRCSFEAPITQPSDSSNEVTTTEQLILRYCELVILVKELFDIARQVFPIPPAVRLVAIDHGAIPSPEEWIIRSSGSISINIYPLIADLNGSTSKYPVFVLSPSGDQAYEVKIHSHTTIEKIITKISKTSGTPTEDVHLIYNGAYLYPGRIVEEYGIRKNEMIQQILRQRERKPVIYVYSPALIQVRVSLRLIPSWSFSAIYPITTVKKDEHGETIEWSVTTKEDGTLVDHESKVEVAYLYWEALSNAGFRQGVSPPNSCPSTPRLDPSVEAFEPDKPIINPQNSVAFSISQIFKYLDDVLLALGLHTEARTSFITYWFPSMLKYPSIALRFLPQAAYESAAPLNVQPAPTAITRVFMLWRGIATSQAGEDGPWAEAILRGRTMHATEWREVVGAKGTVLRDETNGLRVLEWGGTSGVLTIRWVR